MINFVFPKQILVQHIVTITCLILKIKVFLVSCLEINIILILIKRLSHSL